MGNRVGGLGVADGPRTRMYPSNQPRGLGPLCPAFRSRFASISGVGASVSPGLSLPFSALTLLFSPVPSFQSPCLRLPLLPSLGFIPTASSPLCPCLASP